MYHGAARDLEKYFNRPPDQLNENDVKSFLLSIVRDRKLSQSTLKIHYSALRFLYETTLGKGWVIDRIPYPKTTKAIPSVLSKSEIQKIFDATVTLKQRAMLMVTYSAGLRANETARLKITDIDSGRMMIRVNQGKGNKDRYTLLSQVALETLREYWNQKAGKLPYPASQLRHASPGGRRRSAYDSGPPWPFFDQDDHGLSPCEQKESREDRKPSGHLPKTSENFVIRFIRGHVCAGRRTDRSRGHIPVLRS
jgi:integrase